ncbi:hypothetical protein M3Y95_00500100 [Aphelenchoides besseyi]|nr:hypothetical protein M3Y95_00500100 [Aphelenchoides besseyi]
MSKPQLTTYSKAILLMHRNDYVCERPRDNTMSALEFFKYLLISRQFLRASQLYRVYQFAIFEYCNDDNKFYVSAAGRNAVGAWATHFLLSLEEIRTWNRLLNVQYVDLFRYEYIYAEEFSAVSRYFTGHIALCLATDRDNPEHHGGIIKQVQKQLYSLRGPAKSFYTSSEVPQLNLAYSYMDIKNLYQLKQVLAKHQIKELLAGNECLFAPRFDAIIDDNFFDDFPTCPSVERLKLRWKDLDENHDLVSKLTEMIPFLPSVRVLVFCFSAEHYTPEQFSLQQLVVWIRKECRKIGELQKACLPTTDIVFIYYKFKIRKPESRKVIKQLVKEILATTKFNRLRSAEHIIPESSNDQNDVIIKQHYSIELRRKQSNCIADLMFTADLDPLTLNDESEDESTEEESN